MRIHSSLVLSLALLLTPARAAAQGGLGLKGGFTYGSVSNSGVLPGAIGRHTGFTLGITAGTRGDWIGIGADVLYSRYRGSGPRGPAAIARASLPDGAGGWGGLPDSRPAFHGLCRDRGSGARNQRGWRAHAHPGGPLHLRSDGPGAVRSARVRPGFGEVQKTALSCCWPESASSAIPGWPRLADARRRCTPRASAPRRAAQHRSTSKIR